MKLALGTVQFGLDYGISNQQGQVTPAQVKELLHQAKALGIDTLDCAGAYGNSEAVLGALSASENFNLISKVPALTPLQASILPFVEQTLTHLRCNRINTLLFHQADNLLKHPNKVELFSQLALLKKQKKVTNIGVSVYSPDQLVSITQHYPIDTVQAPINVFDQRFLSEEIMMLCQKNSIKLHARSLFLQGLLFIEQAELPIYFKPYQDTLNAFTTMAQYLSCSKLTLALSLLAQKSHKNSSNSSITRDAIKNTVIEKLVVGVCNTQQLVEIVNAYQHAKDLKITTEELSSLADTRLGLINPSLWQL